MASHSSAGGGGQKVPSNVPIGSASENTVAQPNYSMGNVTASVSGSASPTLVTLIDITEPLILHDLYLYSPGGGNWKTGEVEVYIDDKKIYSQTSFYVARFYTLFHCQSVACKSLKVMGKANTTGWSIYAKARISMQ